MQDLNATIFFKAKFHIYATSGENDDLLWKLILDIRSWITKKLNRPGAILLLNPPCISGLSSRKAASFMIWSH